jgi:hypothetical protein
MESKGYKRFATSKAEIQEKRLKLNAERTITQNKAAENGMCLVILSIRERRVFDENSFIEPKW